MDRDYLQRTEVSHRLGLLEKARTVFTETYVYTDSDEDKTRMVTDAIAVARANVALCCILDSGTLREGLTEEEFLYLQQNATRYTEYSSGKTQYNWVWHNCTRIKADIPVSLLSKKRNYIYLRGGEEPTIKVDLLKISGYKFDLTGKPMVDSTRVFAYDLLDMGRNLKQI